MPAVKILLAGTSRDFRLCFRAWEMKDERGIGGEVDKVRGVGDVEGMDA